VTSVLAAYPDLQVTDLAVTPASPVSSSTLTVSWNDGNAGTGATSGAWYDRIVIQNLSKGTTLLDTISYYNAGSIAAGGAAARSYQYALPSGDPGVGDLQVTVTADTYNYVFEYHTGGTGESNNSSQTMVTSVLAPYPDLQVTDLAVTPANPVSGNTLTVSWNDANAGTGVTAGAWYDRIVVQNLSRSTTLLDTTSYYNAGSIPAGGSAARSYQYTLPNGDAGVGEIQVTITADAYNYVFEYETGVSHEAGEANNSASTTVTSTLAVYPDLQVTGLTVTPTSPVSGNTLTVSWNDANAGMGATTGAWYDRIVIQNLGTGATLLDTSSYYNGGNVPAGGATARSYQYTLPNGDPGVGEIRVTITADAYNSVFEYQTGVSHEAGEANNAASATITSSLAVYADLRVTDLTVTPTSPVSGNTLTVSWNDANAGTGATAGAWYDRIVIQNLSEGTTPLDTNSYYNGGSVPAGGATARSYQYTLPNGDPGVGTIRVTVTADTYNYIFEYENVAGGSHESGEANNSAGTSVDSALAAYPDLTADTVQAVPASPKSGEVLTVQWTEHNSGNAAVGRDCYTRVRVVRTDTGTAVWDQWLYLNAQANAQLGAGGAAQRQTSFTLPQGPAGEGTFRAEVTVDAYNQVFEYNGQGTAENNNTAAGSFASTLADYPDLRVSDLSVPSGVQSGQPMTINWSLTNSGTAPVSRAFYHRLAVVHQGTGQVLTSRVFYYDASGAGSIGVGESKPQSFTFDLPDGGPGAGDLRVTAHADYYNNVYEYNALGTGESNNESQITVTSALAPYPGIQVSDVTVPTTDLRAGGQIAVEWTLTNNGTATLAGPFSERIFLSGDSTIGSDRLLATVTFDGTVEAGASVGRMAAVTLPIFAAGDQWIVVQSDSAQQIFELNEQDNSNIGGPIVLPLGLVMTIDHASLREGGTGATVTLSRNGPTVQALVVSLANTQPGSLTSPASMTIPAGQSSMTFVAAPTDDAIVDGDVSATLLASADGFLPAGVTITIADNDVPTLSVHMSPNPVGEGAGNDAVLIRVSRNTGTSGPLTTYLGCSEPWYLDAPLIATIPDGADHVDVFADVQDNRYIDWPRPIAVTASAQGYVTGGDSIGLVDNDTPTLTLSTEATTLSESAGTYATKVTVTRDVVNEISVWVQLTGGGGNVTMPPLVRIAPYQASATFDLGTVNDQEVTGDRTVIITARVADSFTRSPLETGKDDLTLRITEDDGPTLTATTLTPAIREDGTGTIRIRRNTGTTGNLPIDLTSSDPGEATVLAVATIPDGSDFVDVTVAGVEDYTVDGVQNVTIAATALGYGGGAAVITVTDSDLPDLAVTEVVAPASGETGETVTVSYRVANQGVAPAVGSWTERVYVSDRAVIDGRATMLRQYVRSGPLDVGAVSSQSLQVSLPVAVTRYYILVQTDVVGGIEELREGNNARASLPIDVAPAYTATVQAEKDVYGTGEPVLLTGTATRTRTGQPAANEFVKVYVRVNGLERTMLAISGNDGTYQTTFRPLPNEAGNYEVGASHPGLNEFTTQDTFAIAGMRADGTSLSVTPHVPVTRTIQVINRSTVPITGLRAAVSGLPPGGGLALDVSVPDTLPGSGTAALTFTVNATDPELGRGTVAIRLTSDQNAALDVNVNVDVVPLTASLVTTPGSFSDGMLRGQRKTIDFEIRNAGSAPSGEITLLLPDFPWMRLVSPSMLASLDPGGTARVTLELNPAADLPLQLFSGQIAINAANGASRLLGFSFRALSEAQGDARITVTDEYTYFAEHAPNLAGATVRLFDPFTGEKLYEAKTDAEGVALIAGIPEGAYQLEVFAPKHSTYRNRFDVKPGVTNEQTVFITLETVT